MQSTLYPLFNHVPGNTVVGLVWISFFSAFLKNVKSHKARSASYYHYYHVSCQRWVEKLARMQCKQCFSLSCGAEAISWEFWFGSTKNLLAKWRKLRKTRRTRNVNYRFLRSAMSIQKLYCAYCRIQQVMMVHKHKDQVPFSRSSTTLNIVVDYYHELIWSQQYGSSSSTWTLGRTCACAYSLDCFSQWYVSLFVISLLIIISSHPPHIPHVTTTSPPPFPPTPHHIPALLIRPAPYFPFTSSHSIFRGPICASQNAPHIHAL